MNNKDKDNRNSLFKSMFKEGKKIKTDDFKGYWQYNKEKDDIEMHCKDGTIVYLRETNNMWYTLSNILYKHWIEATEENCEVLAKESTLSENAKDIIHAFLEGRRIMDIKHDLIYEFNGREVKVYTLAFMGGEKEEVLITMLDDNKFIVDSIKEYYQDFMIQSK